MKKQFAVRVQSTVRSFNKKGQKLYLTICDADNLPLEIIHEGNKEKLIIATQERCYIDRNGKKTILDSGYQPFDMLQTVKEVDSIVLIIDPHISMDCDEFQNTIDQIVLNINTNPSGLISLNIQYLNPILEGKFSDIIRSFKKKVAPIRRLSLKVNGQITAIISALKEQMEITNQEIDNLQQEMKKKLEEQEEQLLYLEEGEKNRKNDSNRQQLQKEYQQKQDQGNVKNLKLLFGTFPLTRVVQEDYRHSLGSQVASLKYLKVLSIDIQGENGFILAKNCLFNPILNTPLTFQLESFRFNFNCLDFLPEKQDLFPFLTIILAQNSNLKFKLKFPTSREFNNFENAYKMKELIEEYPKVFANSKKIQQFYFSTSGNSKYIDSHSQDSKNGSEDQVLSRQSSARSILKKSTSLIRFSDEVHIDPLKNISFLNGQKLLKKLTLKFDKEIDLNKLGDILYSVNSSLTSFNLRVRHNNYQKSTLDRFLKNINILFGLQSLCLDIQFVEYLFFKMSGSSNPKLMHYKQGRMVKAATSFTIDCNFNSDPVKLLEHFTKFKYLLEFNGQFSGFQHAINDNNYNKGICTADQSYRLHQTCQRIFTQKLFLRRLLIKMILYLSFIKKLPKNIIIGICVAGFIG